MKREIKLRVRDAETKKVIGYERVNVKGHWENMRENRQTWLLGCVTSEDDLIREQYTGVNDRNGNEIYEVDIVKFYTPYQGAEGVGSSSFYNRIVKWEILWWNIMDDYLENGEHGFEIIGNIHPTPELLNTPSSPEKS